MSWPRFLDDPENTGRSYGTLSWNARSKCWVIRGEPAVVEMARRLFPGTDSNRRGEARFTAHRRGVEDLCWFMQRYPLTVSEKDESRWKQAVDDARSYEERRMLARLLPRTAVPPEHSFHGRLMPFQEEGLGYLLQNEKCLLADEMGLGKTVQAIAMLAMQGRYPVLIVPPAHLTRNWQTELNRFLSRGERPIRVHIIRGLKPYDLPAADVYILHYLLLRGWKDTLPALGFETVIFDEIQELRRTGSEKYSAASLLAQSCSHVVGLSGTPIYNRGAEIWNVINILDYHFLGDYESFTRAWCYGYGNEIVQKPDVLGNYLRQEGLMLRRIKQEVLPQLPPKRRLVQEIDWDDAIYRKLMIPVTEKLFSYAENGELTTSQKRILEEQISQEERQATGIAKAPFVAQFVRAILDGGEKVLLFAHHHQVMDIYRQELKSYHPAFITGREDENKKADAAERFMSGKTDLCCVSLRAASGLNLQRATCVVFGELDWSPAVHSQAEDRAHRIGQEDSILCYYLVSPNGSDSVIQSVLGLKVSQFVALMGDAPTTQEEASEDASYARRHVLRLLEQLENREGEA